MIIGLASGQTWNIAAINWDQKKGCLCNTVPAQEHGETSNDLFWERSASLWHFGTLIFWLLLWFRTFEFWWHHHKCLSWGMFLEFLTLILRFNLFLCVFAETGISRVLEWGAGYYNGDIKTRKTLQLQPLELSVDQMGLERSEQLRRLYESLSAGDSNQQSKRPSASLSPEDLTDTEWYYLVCMSFTFNPGQG